MSARGYKPDQAMQFSAENAFREQNVRICVPCNEAGVRTVATRLVKSAGAGGKGKKAMPMCTRHAQAAWKPSLGCVAKITLQGELARDAEED
jgi:hypothetical protein